MADVLVLRLHVDLVRIAAESCGRHFEGMGSAARFLFREKRISQHMKRKLLSIEAAYNVTRHLTVVSSQTLVDDFKKSLLDPDGKPEGGGFDAPAGEPAAQDRASPEPGNEPVTPVNEDMEWRKVEQDLPLPDRQGLHLQCQQQQQHGRQDEQQRERPREVGREESQEEPSRRALQRHNSVHEDTMTREQIQRILHLVNRRSESADVLMTLAHETGAALGSMGPGGT